MSWDNEDQKLRGKLTYKSISYYIEQDKTGYLVKNDHEWIKYLSILIDDAKLRSRIGSAARKEAENNFSINASIRSYSKVICE